MQPAPIHWKVFLEQKSFKNPFLESLIWVNVWDSHHLKFLKWSVYLDAAGWDILVAFRQQSHHYTIFKTPVHSQAPRHCH